MKLYNKKDDIFNLLLLIILPNMAVPFLGILTLVVLNLDNDINSLISTLITMFLSFVIIPYILIKKLYNINITYLGIKKLKPIEISFYIFIICIFEFYLLYKKYSFEPLLILSVQTTIVALTEEFWASCVLFYLLKKILNK